MGNTTEKTDTLPGEVSDLAVRLRALSRAEHSDFSIGDEAADELLRLAGENARLNRIESLATEQRLQMEDVELYLMDVSQPDDEDAHWCDRMKSAIELLVQDCNYAVGQKNKSEAELAAVKSATCDWRHDLDEDTWDSACGERWMFEDGGPEENSVRFCHGCGKRVRLVVEE